VELGAGKVPQEEVAIGAYAPGAPSPPGSRVEDDEGRPVRAVLAQSVSSSSKVWTPAW
jgi:hypothetical protein